ncbi:DUF3060 domain-containing protein [Mycobacterium sp. Y57]|uniref:DUF3060 domain-containing protein n=1 Tax=Mycolicibacterium xanthum TaxID=2796469 RepID=UPI001C8456A7|nr:DUF3060 domain-containing protein [Mycolicibacterium xanthum]MBX7432247.1 DUF3060 domain-containing protein [Mycolicibacterium xanthum]
MEPDGDPEARIRDLERSLADRASASELGTRPYDGSASAGVPVPPPTYDGAPPTYDGAPPAPGPAYPQYGSPQYGSPQYRSPQSGSPYYAPPQQVVQKRSGALLLIPIAVFAVVVFGVIAAIVFFTVGGTGDPSSRSYTPQPPGVAGGGGPVDAPRGPVDAPRGEPRPPTPEKEVTTVEPGGHLGIGGIDQKQTVVCDQGSVSISGMSNTIEIQGDCAAVTVSGFENIVTVESAATINASGFDNHVTYRTGEPDISNSGSGNVVEQG